MIEYKFICTDCKEEKVHINSNNCGGTGYAIDKQGNKICYECCAIRDINDMIATGQATLYLTIAGKDASCPNWPVLTNWPGTLKFTVERRKKGLHNFAGQRIDVWFNDYNGDKWHGVVYGDNT